MTGSEGRLTQLAEEAEDWEERAAGRAHRLRRARRIGGGAALVLALAAGGLWLWRKPIADTFIAHELAARGVQGRYEITRIGPRTQRLENLVIGDPRHPDLIARFIEVDIGWGFTGARISRVQASGVRLVGKVKDGNLDLGQVNKLLEGGEGKAELPDWLVELDEARADIATDFGPLVFSLDGTGPMRSGFKGTLSLAASMLKAGDCTLDRLIAPMDVSTENGQLVLDGPATSRSLACTGLALTLDLPKLDLNIRSDLALEALSGAVTFYADGARQQQRSFGPLSGLVAFKGSSNELRGSASLSTLQTQVDGIETGAVKLGGNFALRPAGRERALAWLGDATVDDIRPGEINLSKLVTSAAGTPVEPLARKLADAITQIGKDNRLTLSGKLNMLGTRGNASLDKAELTAASGARITTAPQSAIKMQWPDGRLQASGTLALGGGGLPEGRIALATDARGAISGIATMAEYRAGSARLSLTPAQFSFGADGRGQIRTTLTLDGPLPDGAIAGLNVPIDGRLSDGGGLALAGDCAPVRWRSLRLSSLALNPADVRLCGIANGRLQIGALALSGKIGESPLAMSAASARYALADGHFELERPDVRIGAGDQPVRFSASQLQGGKGEKAGTMAGSIEGGAGRIGAVSLDLTNIVGKWTYADGRLAVDGGLQVSDTQPDRRFNPLAGRDVHLTFANGRIEARGMLVHPARNVAVAAVAIRHDLASGAGQADLTLDRLRFGDALQPDDLTPLSLGVVANVRGVVEGAGHIRWTGDKVTSDGRFSTQGMSLAAAFGPASGLSTTINFTDLLGMRTAPGQIVTLASANPGIEVHDGVIRYQLLSNEQLAVEGGHWPFSGGDLDLLPATIDLDAHKPRHFVFRVVGLDAGAFINTMELKNISATGTFDGLLPMIFDETGGRIEGGVLVARQQGDPPLVLNNTTGLNVPCDQTRQAGNLSYVGDVSNAQLNAFSKLAFDALKNLRYRCLAIMLDGALDGEFVTRLSINGINQGTEEARKSFIARPFLGLPFIFNVRIEAPFRGLLGTAAGLADPSVAVRRAMGGQIGGEQIVGEQIAPASDGPLAVQPPDSDKDLKGNPK